MTFRYSDLRYRITALGLWPSTRLARVAWYVLGLDLLLFLLKKLLLLFRSAWSESLGGWITFLTLLAFVLFSFLGYRWLKAKMLWRLRNRLIVTYVFIGVIPVVLLLTLALGSLYLFAGQFATFIVTSGLNSKLESLQATNTAIAHELAGRLQRGEKAETAALAGLRASEKSWADRRVYAWLNEKIILSSLPSDAEGAAPTLQGQLKPAFHNVVRDRDRLFLRAVDTVPVSGGKLTVLSSEPFDQHLLAELAADLGDVTLYASGVNLRSVDEGEPTSAPSGAVSTVEPGTNSRKQKETYVLDTRQPLTATYSAGTVPPATRSGDREVRFVTSVFVVNWQTGDTS
ncbi:MAG TPA: hypothetical protein VFJ47_00245, partial [Terriglobales bacterium]|nr:hypothetical protein [Terriglobales bacterium]